MSAQRLDLAIEDFARPRQTSHPTRKFSPIVRSFHWLSKPGPDILSDGERHARNLLRGQPQGGSHVWNPLRVTGRQFAVPQNSHRVGLIPKPTDERRTRAVWRGNR